MQNVKWIAKLFVVLGGISLLLVSLYFEEYRLKSEEQPLAGLSRIQVSSPSSPKSIFHNNAFVLSTATSYSSFYCIGGERKEAWANNPVFLPLDYKRRLCLLQNVAIRNRSLVFYTSPHQLPYELDFPMGHPAKFQPTFVFPTEFRNEFALEIEFPLDRSPPREQQQQQQHVFNKEVCYIFASCGFGPKGWGGNIQGHDYDGVWTVFSDLADMHMLSTSNILVLHHCDAFSSKTWSLLSDTILHMDSFPLNETKIDCVFPSRQRKEWYRFPDSLRTPLYTTMFRNFVYARFRISPELNRLKCRIGVNFKRNRHRFPNHYETVDHLRMRFPQCQVLDLHLAELTMKEEVEIMSSLSVFISPSGGGSFSAVFLPDGATAIFGNPCWPGVAKTSPHSHGTPEFDHLKGEHLHCYRMENYIWTFFPYFTKRYISPASVHELQYDHLEPWQYPLGLPRNQGYSFNLSFPLVDALVEEALLS